MKLLKFLAFCILFLALGITLGNVANLQNQNTNLKTDNDILIEQLTEYENNLILIQSKLIIAEEEREELYVSVKNFEDEIVELQSQAVVDSEALATAEANLATAQQLLIEKDNEILELKANEEKFSLICSLSGANVSPYLEASNFETTDENFGIYSLYEPYVNHSDWVNFRPTNAFFSLPCKSFTICDSRVGPIFSLDGETAFDVLIETLNIFQSMGFKKFTLNLYVKFYAKNVSSNLFGYTIEPSDKLLFDIDAILSSYMNIGSNWLSIFFPDKINYLNGIVSYATDVTVQKLSFSAVYSQDDSSLYENLTTITVGDNVYKLSTDYCYANSVTILDSNLKVDKLILNMLGDAVCIDTNLKCFSFINQTFYRYLYEDGDLVNKLLFSENSHIEKFYIPNDVDITLIRSDILSKVNEFVFLPFNAQQLSFIIAYSR